jgi:hypothetical protein
VPVLEEQPEGELQPRVHGAVAAGARAGRAELEPELCGGDAHVEDAPERGITETSTYPTVVNPSSAEYGIDHPVRPCGA